MERVRGGLVLALLLAPVSAPAAVVGQVTPAFTVPSIDPPPVIVAKVLVSYPAGADATACSATAFGVATLAAAFPIEGNGIVRHIYRGAVEVRSINEHVRRPIDGSHRRQATRIAAPSTSSREGSSRS